MRYWKTCFWWWKQLSPRTYTTNNLEPYIYWRVHHTENQRRRRKLRFCFWHQIITKPWSILGGNPHSIATVTFVGSTRNQLTWLIQKEYKSWFRWGSERTFTDRLVPCWWLWHRTVVIRGTTCGSTSPCPEFRFDICHIITQFHRFTSAHAFNFNAICKYVLFLLTFYGKFYWWPFYSVCHCPWRDKFSLSAPTTHVSLLSYLASLPLV